MQPDQIVYLIPNTAEWLNKPIPGYSWVRLEKYICTLSHEKLDYETTTIKELMKSLRYNPFEQSGPTPEKDLMLMKMANDLEYLICLKELGL